MLFDWSVHVFWRMFSQSPKLGLSAVHIISTAYILYVGVSEDLGENPPNPLASSSFYGILMDSALNSLEDFHHFMVFFPHGWFISPFSMAHWDGCPRPKATRKVAAFLALHHGTKTPELDSLDFSSDRPFGAEKKGLGIG